MHGEAHVLHPGNMRALITLGWEDYHLTTFRSLRSAPRLRYSLLEIQDSFCRTILKTRHRAGFLVWCG